MVAKHKPLIGSIIAILCWGGLEVSGYTNLPLAIILWAIALVLALFWLRRKASLEPSHLIIIGLVGVLVFAAITLGGVLWQKYGPAVYSVSVREDKVISNIGIPGTPEYFKNWMNQPKEVVRNKPFENEVVTLDGFSFINCTFRNVKFLFNGTAPFDLERNQIYNPIIHIKRPEFYVLLQLLKAFGHLPDDFKIIMNGKVTDL